MTVNQRVAGSSPAGGASMVKGFDENETLLCLRGKFYDLAKAISDSTLPLSAFRNAAK